MATFEIYRAVADPQIALAASGTASPFTIEVRFLDGLSQRQKDAFKSAADRWCRIIVGDLPAIEVEGETIDDVLILARGKSIDGPRGVLGQAGPTHLRPANAGRSAFLPAKGLMSFDTADLKQMEAEDKLNDVITHEMGHVLGIGTTWFQKALLKGAGTINPTFSGPRAMEKYGKLRGGESGPTPVPVANEGGQGTRDAHWRETVFGNELMSGIIAEAGNPISRVTAASLQDLGYEVDMSAAEAYTLPSLLMLAELGLLAAHEDHGGRGEMLIPTPLVLPEESLL